MLDVAHTESWFALQMAFAPCLLGYGAIAARLREECLVRKEIGTEQEGSNGDGCGGGGGGGGGRNRYWKWIELIGVGEYMDAVEGGRGKFSFFFLFIVFPRLFPLEWWQEEKNFFLFISCAYFWSVDSDVGKTRGVAESEPD